MNVLRTLWDRLGIHTWADVRNTIHLLTPVLVTLLSTQLAPDVAEAIGVAIVAIFSPTIAFWNSTSALRAWIYGLVVPLQGILVVLGVVTQAQYATAATIVLSVISALLASNNTPTTAPPTAATTVGDKVTGKTTEKLGTVGAL